jgi:hypothetical protein
MYQGALAMFLSTLFWNRCTVWCLYYFVWCHPRVSSLSYKSNFKCVKIIHNFWNNKLFTRIIKVKYYFWWFTLKMTASPILHKGGQINKTKYHLLVSELSKLYLPIHLQRKCVAVTPCSLSRNTVWIPLFHVAFRLASERKSRRRFSHYHVFLDILSVLTINIFCSVPTCISHVIRQSKWISVGSVINLLLNL